MITYYGLGFTAGVLSLLAPCVLPLIPIVLGTSSKSSKWGPIANALGLTFSFTLIGILTSLFSGLFDINFIQKIGAIILVLMGAVLLIPRLKFMLTSFLAPLASQGYQLQGKIKGGTLGSEFLMGGVLGMVWGPCSGPTLALAFGMASQSSEWVHGMFIFFFFGLGAGVGLISLGFILTKFAGLTGKILKQEVIINRLTGTIAVTLGLVILFDYLPIIEGAILDLLPLWMVNLATSI